MWTQDRLCLLIGLASVMSLSVCLSSQHRSQAAYLKPPSYELNAFYFWTCSNEPSSHFICCLVRNKNWFPNKFTFYPISSISCTWQFLATGYNLVLYYYAIAMHSSLVPPPVPFFFIVNLFCVWCKKKYCLSFKKWFPLQLSIFFAWPLCVQI